MLRIHASVPPLALAAVATTSLGQGWRINAFDLGRADAVVIGTVSISAPLVIELGCRSGEGYEPGALPAERFAVFTLVHAVALKGNVPETIRVIADAPHPPGGSGPDPLPAGRAILIILQAPKDGWFDKPDNIGCDCSYPITSSPMFTGAHVYFGGTEDTTWGADGVELQPWHWLNAYTDRTDNGD